MMFNLLCKGASTDAGQIGKLHHAEYGENCKNTAHMYYINHCLHHLHKLGTVTFWISSGFCFVKAVSTRSIAYHPGFETKKRPSSPA